MDFFFFFLEDTIKTKKNPHLRFMYAFIMHVFMHGFS